LPVDTDVWLCNVILDQYERKFGKRC
jgi:hypothetical protein